MFSITRGRPSANVARTMRFTEDLYEQLKQVAQENDVSFNLLVLQCCIYALSQLSQDASNP